MIPGIDVSHWQSDIDWSEVKRSGVKFAFIKATEFPDKKTALFVDNKCQENINGAKANGIHWSAYHFFRTHIDPVIQAQSYCETIGEFSSLPPVLDLEAAGSKGERLNHKVRMFLEEVEKITHRKPIIYTSGGFWRSYMAYEKRAHTDWAREYPLWMAQYTTLWPGSIYPWAAWDFWQYSDKGKLPGIKTHVDLNWFVGSEAELIEKFVNSRIPTIPVYQFEEDDVLVGQINETELSSGSPSSKSFYEENYRGDYQDFEEKDASGKRVNAIPGNKNPKYTSNEQNWIREYFF